MLHYYHTTARVAMEGGVWRENHKPSKLETTETTTSLHFLQAVYADTCTLTEPSFVGFTYTAVALT
jgi:hypothetical protein